MKKRYVVKLTSEERHQLDRIVNRGREAAYRRRHAQVLLLVDEGKQGPGFFDKDAAERIGFTRRTVEQISERCVTEGLTAALERKKRSRNRSHKLERTLVCAINSGLRWYYRLDSNTSLLPCRRPFQ